MKMVGSLVSLFILFCLGEKAGYWLEYVLNKMDEIYQGKEEKVESLYVSGSVSPHYWMKKNSIS